MSRSTIAFVGALGILTAAATPADDEKGFEETRRILLEGLRGAAGEEIKSDKGLPGLCLTLEGVQTERDREIREVLDNEKLYFEKKQWTLEAIQETISRSGKIEVRLSSGIREIMRKKRTIPKAFGSDLTFDDVVHWMSREMGGVLRWRIGGGALHISTAEERQAFREKLREGIERSLGQSTSIIGGRFILVRNSAFPVTPRTRQIRKNLDARRLFFDLDNTPANNAFQFLKSVTGTKFVVSDAARKVVAVGGLTVTSEGSDLKLSAALDQILKSIGGNLAWRVRDDGVHILTEDEARRADESPSFLLVDVGDLLGVE